MADFISKYDGKTIEELLDKVSNNKYAVQNIVILTQKEYDMLPTWEEGVLYLIQDDENP